MIADCEPDVSELHELLLEKAKRVIIKLSPMLDITRALSDMPGTVAVHVVAVNNECKELLLVLENGGECIDPMIHCINLPSVTPENEWPKAFTFTFAEEATMPCEYATEIGRFLYEPHVALMKAGAFKTIAHRYSLKKLHANSHLYTANAPIANFPGRSFEVAHTGGFGKKELKELSNRLGKANITVRNFPLSVAELRKKLKIADGGDTYLFATTLSNDSRAWIECKKITV